MKLLSRYDDIGVDYRILQNYSCDTSGCEDEGICRCGIIEGSVVEHINYAKVTKYCSEQSDPIALYVWNKLLVLNKVTVDVIIHASPGYYGEEVESVDYEFFNCSLVEDQFNKLSVLSPVDQLFELLKMEYGHVAEIIAKAKNVLIRNAHPSKIKWLNDKHFTKCKEEMNSNYHKIIDPAVPIGIYMEKGSQQFIIDGYHRAANLLDKRYNNSNKIHSILVLE